MGPLFASFRLFIISLFGRVLSSSDRRAIFSASFHQFCKTERVKAVNIRRASGGASIVIVVYPALDNICGKVTRGAGLHMS